MTADSGPRIRSIATVVPPHRITQDEVRDFGARFFAGDVAALDRLLDVYDNAEIGEGYCCLPKSWYAENGHGFGEKNRLFLEHAVALLKEAAMGCLADGDTDPRDIDLIVTVSTTGIATPSLDARLMTELPFRRDVQRLPIFGLGCAGGVLGLARAAACARAAPGSRVLVLVVELCTLTFRGRDRSARNLVATALFRDGAAAVLLTDDGPGPEIASWGEYTWPDSLDIMGWDVADDGFGVVFSRSIPDLVRSNMRQVTEEFLSSQDLRLRDIDSFVCHPGGAKVLDALEAVFDLPAGGLEQSRSVLRDYGNMSAATVLFVLERILRDGTANRHLLTSLGPGFSAGFLLLQSM